MLDKKFRVILSFRLELQSVIHMLTDIVHEYIDNVR